MEKQKWWIRGVFGLIGWVCIGIGIGHAGVIPPVNITSPYAPKTLGTTNTLSVSIYKPISPGSTTVTDVTDTWLPEVGEDVYVVINKRISSQSGNVPQTLLSPPVPRDSNPTSSPFSSTTANTTNPFLNSTTLTTSHYRGVCTNFGLNTDTAADYIFNTSPTVLTVSPSGTISGYKLTPTDCGGMAVLDVTLGTESQTFILPQDSDADGIPNIYEASNPAATCKIGNTSVTQTLNATDDKDCTPTPALTGLVGDGISNFDEYRGFITSGVHIRTDWRKKDVFVHLVNAQCLPAGAAPPSPIAAIFPAGATSLFSNLDSLIYNAQTHALGYTPGAINSTTNEMIDKFFSYSVNITTLNGTFNYKNSPSDTTTTTVAPADDRQINLNALYPKIDSITLKTYQKAARITECLDTSDTSATPLLGSSGWGSANGPDNAILYTQRIANYTDSLIGGRINLFYSTYTGGTWSTPTSSDRNSFVSNSIKFYLAMEIGHSVRLNTTSANGYHNPAGTGGNVDQTIVTTSTPTDITFRIPSLYLSASQSNFRLRN